MLVYHLNISYVLYVYVQCLFDVFYVMCGSPSLSFKLTPPQCCVSFEVAGFREPDLNGSADHVKFLIPSARHQNKKKYLKSKQ